MKPTCLITGASAGIGAACAIRAAEAGYDLALTYNTDRAGAEAAAKAANEAGAKTIIIQADVAKEEDIERLYAEFDAAYDQLDALINNAGIVGQTQRVSEMTSDRMRQIFDVNVIGAMLVAQAAVKRMEPRETGVIVNISSAAARLGSANQYVDYAASKAAIDTFTKGLSDEVAPKGIRVMAIAPGLISTELHAKGGEPGRADKLAHMVPMRRPGSADEIAKAVLWLMSDGASYITGSTLDVTGGR